MERVGILTDSSSTIPIAFGRERGIGIGSVSVVIEGQAYIDAVTLEPEVLYDAVARGADIVTSGVNAGDFEQQLAWLYQEHDAVVAVVIDGRISSTYRNAKMAGLEFDDHPYFVPETGTAGMGLGAIALEAARHAQAGADFDTVCDVTRQAISLSDCYVVTRNVKGFQDIQRLSQGTVAENEMRDAVIVIQLRDGRIAPVARAQDYDEANRLIVERIAARLPEDRPLTVVASHARAEAGASALLDELGRRYTIAESHLFPNTATVTAVVGVPSYGIGVASRIDL